jgi:DNA-binding response OmpR family regulator
MSVPNLAQRQILVVEDEPLLAMGIMDEIEHHNGIVLGPVGTLEQGLMALRDMEPDACILNIRLGPNMVYELADRLIEQKIPFIFASAESRESIPDRFDDIPLHEKPIDMVKAAAALMQIQV